MVPRHRKRITLGPYLLLSTLGKGEFAKVKLGIHVESGQKVSYTKQDFLNDRLIP